MSKWVKGCESPNPKGRPKTLYLEDYDHLRAKKEMHGKATQILNERWEEVVHAMLDAALKGNPQAAAFVANYVLGKPKDTVIHDVTDEAKDVLKLVISKDEANL